MNDLKNKQTRETDIPEVEFATSTSNKKQGYYSPMARMHDSLPGGAASKNSEKRHVVNIMVFYSDMSFESFVPQKKV